MPIALYALAIGGFGIGLTEFVIAGLLPEVAADFHVTEAVAGGLISGYALAVAVGAIALTAALTRVDRRTALLALMILFIAGNVLSALAPDYGLMLLGRILAALCHGAFFGIGSVVATDLVPAEKKAAAISVMFTGLTVANVLGVPLGTFLGQAAGWRSTFWAIAAVGVLAFAGIAALTPATPAAADASPLREFRVFASVQVWLSILVTILGFGGMFGAFSYLAYTLTGVSGFPAAAVPWLLIVFGAGLFAGNILGGRAADRNLPRTLTVLLAALTVVLALFALTAGNRFAAVAGLLLMGGFGFGTVPGLQMRILGHAQQAPTLASGANIAAFNVGNAFGAYLGGLTISAGLGYRSPLWAGAAVTLAALLVYVLATRLPAGEHARPDLATTTP
ncbi:MFS transporter [Actinoplanes cyaneus]|uniref:MFS transporter n=1 Tax=Actinoplanes cyaneus TaxID=52696 RepID=A0A919IDR8_9ACTN|nr:MFS transporter [Actinoplanes cyaneus]MCW2136095.1 MFS transporter, DHA1 family, inner membrane transport protein [Actinoplanes cyaneus]GID62537.1 MFS transporter [Actinoplanes cyaneus]